MAESMVVVEEDLQVEDDGMLLVQDVKQQMTEARDRAGTGATTDEDCVDAAEEFEEAWDWAIEGHSSTEGSVNKWILDDFLVTGEASVEQPKESEPAPEAPAAEAEKPSAAAETSPASKASDSSMQQNSPVALPQSPTNSVGAEKEKEEEAHPAAPEPEEEEHGYRCTGCNCRIFCGADVLSSNYQAMTGPGYLIATTQNVTYAPETQSVLYTTGTYKIRQVWCEFCDNKLGVTYVVAPDARNQYKVGKFLMGADRLILPPGVTHPKAV